MPRIGVESTGEVEMKRTGASLNEMSCQPLVGL